jgi:hypothetical protein
MPKCIALASRRHAARFAWDIVHAALFMLAALGAAWARVKPRVLASEAEARLRERRVIAVFPLLKRAKVYIQGR